MSNPTTNMSAYSYGGVAFNSATQPKESNNLGAIIKNKDIFEKAQQREKTVDWYAKLQESKEAFLRSDHSRLPLL